MKIPLVGQTYQQRSLPFDAQRTINLYPVLDEQGKEVSALYGTPGITVFSTAGPGPVRGTFAAANARAFTVANAGLYEIFSDGSSLLRGTLDSLSGIVSIDENGLQLGICDGTSVYIFTYSSNAFVKVIDVDLPSSGTITFIDGYFVITKNSSGSFYISALYDGTSWAALDFATAESSPDNLIRVMNAVGQLWLFGSKTTEIWTNTGASAFPFERISGAKMEVGILAAHTAIPVDNSIFWVGKDNIGSGIVYRAQGFSPLRISTEAIELLIAAATSPSTLRAYTYQQDGHIFYVLTGGGMGTTLVYDIATQQWHERAYLNSFGAFEQHLACCGMFAFNQQLVGSRTNGKIYTMALTIYSDDGDEMASERTYTHLSNEGQRQKYSQLEIAMESGVGNQSDLGQDPKIILWVSKNGGRSYSNGYTTSFGKVGKYLTRAVFRRLGIVTDMTFKIRITDPVKRVLIGSYLK